MRFAAPLCSASSGVTVKSAGLDLSSFSGCCPMRRATLLRAAPPGLADALRRRDAACSMSEYAKSRFKATAGRRRATTASKRASQSTSGNRWLWPTLATPGDSRSHLGLARAPSYAGIDTTSAGGEISPMTPPAAPISTPNTVTVPDSTSLVGRAPGRGIETRLRVHRRFDAAHQRHHVVRLRPPDVRDELGEPAAGVARPAGEGGGDSQGASSRDREDRRIHRQPGNAAANREAVGSAWRRTSAQRSSKPASTRATPKAEGYGDAHPVADNSTDAGRAQNRRIFSVGAEKVGKQNRDEGSGSGTREGSLADPPTTSLSLRGLCCGSIRVVCVAKHVGLGRYSIARQPNAF